MLLVFRFLPTKRDFSILWYSHNPNFSITEKVDSRSHPQIVIGEFEGHFYKYSHDHGGIGSHAKSNGWTVWQRRSGGGGRRGKWLRQKSSLLCDNYSVQIDRRHRTRKAIFATHWTQMWGRFNFVRLDEFRAIYDYCPLSGSMKKLYAIIGACLSVDCGAVALAYNGQWFYWKVNQCISRLL